MANLDKNQRFWRGLFFLSAGVFLLVRFAAQGDNAFFVGAMWLTAIISLIALGIFFWNIVSQND